MRGWKVRCFKGFIDGCKDGDLEGISDGCFVGV